MKFLTEPIYVFYGRLLPIFGVAIASACLLTVVSLFQLAKIHVEESGRDSLVLRSDGIYTHQMEFEKNGKRVSVLGMMHFGDQDFYDAQIRRI